MQINNPLHRQSFTRAAFAVLRGGGNAQAAEQYARQRWADDADALATLTTKAGVTPTSVSDLQNLVAGAPARYLDVLASQTLLAALDGATPVPFQAAFVRPSALPVAHEVLEGAPTPMTGLSFATDYLAIRKWQGAFLVSNEIAIADGAVALRAFGAILDQAAISVTDSAVVQMLVAAATTTNASGATAITTASDIGAALDALGAAAIGAPLASPVVILSPRLAVTLALRTTTAGELAFPGLTLRGGVLAGMPAYVAASVPLTVSGGGSLFIVDRSRVAYADLGLDIDASTNGAVQASDSPATGATSLVSLFQSNLRAMRLTRWLNMSFAPGAVARIDNVH